MGTKDPYLSSSGKIDFRIQCTISMWEKIDPHPHQVKPIPVQVLWQVCFIAQHLPPDSVFLCALADMIIIAFFFLLRPGEYTDAPSDTFPFRSMYVQLSIDDRRLDIAMCSLAELSQARFASLTFTDQKNGVRGEVTGLACSGDPYPCPVLALILIRHITHLWANSASSNTPIVRVFHHPNSPSKSKVTPAVITKQLRQAVQFLGPDLGFLLLDVLAQSLRAAGATALLVARVDTGIIRFLGRWRSDEMLRYLYLQAAPIMANYARLMLQSEYTLIPN